SQRSHEGADVEPPRYRSRIHLFRVPDEAAAPEAYDGAPVGGAAIAAVAWPPVSGDGGREFTQTEFRDSSPRFSNDGARLAFQRVSAKKQPPQLHVMSLTGGEPVRLT